MINSSVTATELRSRLFEILNNTIKGSEFVIEKDGRPAARLIPYNPTTSAVKIKSILSNFKSAFSKIDPNIPWSVLETAEWKKKERKYLKSL